MTDATWSFVHSLIDGNPDIAIFSTTQRYPIRPCDFCCAQQNLKRKRVKRLIEDLQREVPELWHSMLKALSNIAPSQLMDRRSFDFESLSGARANLSDELDAVLSAHSDLTTLVPVMLSSGPLTPLISPNF
jgi:hypothetical protein